MSPEELTTTIAMALERASDDWVDVWDVIKSVNRVDKTIIGIETESGDQFFIEVSSV